MHLLPIVGIFLLVVSCNDPIGRKWINCESSSDSELDTFEFSDVGLTLSYPKAWEDSTEEYSVKLRYADSVTLQIVSIDIWRTSDTTKSILSDRNWLGIPNTRGDVKEYGVSSINGNEFRFIISEISFMGTPMQTCLVQSVNQPSIILFQWIPKLHDYPYTDFCEMHQILQTIKMHHLQQPAI